MTDKDKLLHLAARVDQLMLEFRSIASDMGFSAGHEAMVATYHLVAASRFLMKTAAKFEDKP